MNGEMGREYLKMPKFITSGYFGVERSIRICLVIMILFFLTLVTTWASDNEIFSNSMTGAHEYGLPFDALHTSKGVVKHGQTLASILRSYHVPYGKINALVLKADKVFDVRKIGAGKHYVVVAGKNSLTQPSYFIYEEGPVDYVVFKVADPVNVYRGKKKVKWDIREASGVIETSLSDNLKQHQFAHQLTVKLSDLYAWSIDFHHLQRGDHYKVIFQEQHIAGKPQGLGKILAARFNHQGRDFYAFYFENENGGKYYDEKGGSVEKALLKTPLKNARITSRFARRRLHPILKRSRPHLGIDFAAPRGTPIVSVGDGVIVESAHDKDRGKYLTVRHNAVYATQYYHMSRFAKGIKKGVRVNQGDIIGYVGSTGLATGPHLEFRLLKRGCPVDPLKEEISADEPLEKVYLEVFKRQTAALKLSLDRIEMVETSASLQASPTF